MVKGKFITFEGCEGVGKTTQMKMLRDYLDGTNQPAEFMREPGGNDISEKIRNLILDKNNADITDKCEAFLYSSARVQLMEQKIIPMLNDGKMIVCDRFTDSTLAYQGVARGLGVEFIEHLNKLACGDFMPDATIFLDLEPKNAFSRKGGADTNDRIEMQSQAFHQKVYEGYLLVCDLYPDRIIKIAPTGTKYETNRLILRALQERGIIR